MEEGGGGVAGLPTYWRISNAFHYLSHIIIQISYISFSIASHPPPNLFKKKLSCQRPWPTISRHSIHVMIIRILEHLFTNCGGKSWLEKNRGLLIYTDEAKNKKLIKRQGALWAKHYYGRRVDKIISKDTLAPQICLRLLEKFCLLRTNLSMRNVTEELMRSQQSKFVNPSGSSL